MKSPFLIKAALGAILLTALHWAVNSMTGVHADLPVYGWSLLANFMVAFILGYLTLHSVHRGLRLTAIIFAIYFLIGNFNLLIEAWIFDVTDRPETTREMLAGLLVALVFSPAYVYLFRKEPARERLEFVPRSYGNWIGKIVLADFLYLVFYLAAGMALYVFYPSLMDFYEDKIPPFGLMIQTQLFFRGLIFAGIAILILRTTRQSLAIKAVLIGLAFAVIGGIAPLIPPSEFMPGYIRLGHGVEVGISNFLFGLALGYLLQQKEESVLSKVSGEPVQEASVEAVRPVEWR